MSICFYGLYPFLLTADMKEQKAPSPSLTRQYSIETDRVSKDFIEFLKTYHKAGHDVYKQCKVFLEAVQHKKVCESVFLIAPSCVCSLLCIPFKKVTMKAHEYERQIA